MKKIYKKATLKVVALSSMVILNASGTTSKSTGSIGFGSDESNRVDGQKFFFD